jgi:[ribosomal protein S5]-alanine N-acetyltransferase
MEPVKPFPLSTDRLIIREFRAEDEAAIQAYASDVDVTRDTAWGPNTPAVTQAVLRTWIADQEHWPRRSIPLAIELRAEHALIGGTGFSSINPDTQTGSFGYVLNKNYWGRGLATEAARAVLRLGFEALDLHRITAECFVRNPASQRVLEKLGLRREGHFLQGIRKDGEWLDLYLYAVLREEWIQSQMAGQQRASEKVWRPQSGKDI